MKYWVWLKAAFISRQKIKPHIDRHVAAGYFVLFKDHDTKMNNNIKIPEYYRKTYLRWYRWFSIIYDLFMKIFSFLFFGGFGGEKRLRELAIEWLEPHPGDKIIDICSGSGTLTIMLADKLHGEGETVGIELSPDLVAKARKKNIPPGVEFIHGDAQQIDYPDYYFDKAVIFGALHEMPYEVRRNVLSEAYRIIKPGGSIFFLEHNQPKRKWKATCFSAMERFNPEYKTYKDLLKRGLNNQLKEAGFEIIRTDIISWEFFQIVLAVKPDLISGDVI
jgi:ubiquinone/menaquinone biosynthesis C-methylase UbiE